MSFIEKLIYFILLPMIATLSYPPETIFGGTSALTIIGIALIFFVLLGIALWRGRNLALTFSIFLQGMNVIIRLMMFFPYAYAKDGTFFPEYVITILFGLLISFFLILYLDTRKVRSTMIS